MKPSPLRIFVVEDHADTLHMLRDYLEEEGHAVITASSAREALDRLPGSGCNMLISDVSLKDGSGWDLLRQADLPGPIFAVAVSGFGMSMDRARSQAAGFRHHLVKPIDPDELDAVLAEAMARLSS